MEFKNGATITLGASWDVWSNGHHNMELYGEDGSMFVPDPNFFGGLPWITIGEKEVKKLRAYAHPFGVPNQKHKEGAMANYRVAGLADMAQAIAEDRPHRCSLELSLHAVDVMTSILRSGETGKFVNMTTTCERPEPLDIKQAKALLAKKPALKKTVKKKKA